MANKYTRNDLKLSINVKEIEVVDCPDCGFEYNAEHSNDNDKTIYECPLCELAEKDDAIRFAIKHLENSDIRQVKLVVNALVEAMES